MAIVSQEVPVSLFARELAPLLPLGCPDRGGRTNHSRDPKEHYLNYWPLANVLSNSPLYCGHTRAVFFWRVAYDVRGEVWRATRGVVVSRWAWLKPSLWARLAAIMVVMPTIEPDDRSMPPMMMTCVTPTAPNVSICSGVAPCGSASGRTRS